VEDRVLEAVSGVFTSIVTVNDPPDPDHPDLARYRTGKLLADVRELVESNRMLGIAYRLPPGPLYSHTARIDSLESEHARVTACLIDDGHRVAVAHGEILNDAVITKLFEMDLVLEAGQWRASEMRWSDRWEGVAGCAHGF
jgi:hypothetical protein